MDGCGTFFFFFFLGGGGGDRVCVCVFVHVYDGGCQWGGLEAVGT